MNPSDSLRPDFDRVQQRSLVVGIIGLAVLAAGFFFDRTQFFRSYLYGFVFWSGMGIGCLAVLMLNHVVGGKWGLVIRRFLEAGTRTLPLFLILVIPVLASLGTLYIWARPEAARDDHIRQISGYLNIPFFIIRTLVYFGLWMLWSRLLNKWSDEQDRTGDPALMTRMRRLSAPGLVLITVTATFAFVDWIMSLEPYWFSTIYGAMFLIGQTLETFAFITALLVIFSTRKPFSDYVTPQHFHSLGNLILTFTCLWAYTAFSQYLIIWSGNLPDEIPWYVRRAAGGWNIVAILVIVFHFCVPFLLLLQREVKRRANWLLGVCIGLLVVRVLDVFWIVVPSFREKGIPVHWQDAAAIVGIGGLWVAAFFWQLKTRPVLPVNDPRLAGKVGEMVVF